jgi:hypothetical protein
MLSVLLYLLCDVVNGLHGIYISFLNDHLQVLRHFSFLLRLAVNNVELLALVGTQAILKEHTDASSTLLHHGVGLEYLCRLECLMYGASNPLILDGLIEDEQLSLLLGPLIDVIHVLLESLVVTGRYQLL